MRFALLSSAFLLVFLSAVHADDKQKEQDKPAANPAEELKTMILDFQKAERDYQSALKEAKTDEDRKKAQTMRPSTQDLVEKLMQFAKKNPKDPAALDALALIIQERLGPDATKAKGKAVEMVLSDHIDSDKLGNLLWALAQVQTDTADKILRAAIEKNPHHDIQGTARFILARHLKNKSDIATRLNQGDADKLSKEAEKLYEEVVNKYGDVKRGQATIGKAAKGELFELQHLAIGKTAPDIEGEDIDGKKFKLSEYRGKVVSLVFWGNWCGPCRAMYPHERELVKNMEGKPFALVAVNSDRDKDALKKVLEKEEITWRFWFDGGSPGGPIASTWNVHSWPTTYVLDDKGVIRYKNVRGPAMEEAVEKLVKEAEKKEK